MLLGLEDVEQAEADRAAQTDGSSPRIDKPGSQAPDQPWSAAGASAPD